MSALNLNPELKLRFLWLAIGYCLIALVVYLSLTSSPVDTGLNFPYEDKVSHAFAYFVLMSWFAQIYHHPLQRNLIALSLVMMGVLLEYLQSFDPHRMTEFADMVANATGVGLGFLLSLSSARHFLQRIEKNFS